MQARRVPIYISYVQDSPASFQCYIPQTEPNHIQERTNVHTISIPTQHSPTHSRTNPANRIQKSPNATLNSLNTTRTTSLYPRNVQSESKPLSRNSILNTYPSSSRGQTTNYDISSAEFRNAARVETKAPGLQASGDGTGGGWRGFGSGTATSPR